MKLSGEIGAGRVLRIHSGIGPFSKDRDKGEIGSDYYMYMIAGQSRSIWNNEYGDTSVLW